MTGLISAIEITFPEQVELTQQDQKDILALITRMTDRYCETHPGRTMWAFGVGQKMTSNPLALSDSDPLQFDDSVFAIECAERADYEWPCAKCGKPQGDHKGHITQPPAGDCEFTVSQA